MNASKLLVIGLDGVPRELLETVFAQDWMPFLKTMWENGYRADLASTVPPLSAPAWVTFATGVNPGEHGVLHFVSLRPGAAARQGKDEAQWVFHDCASLLNADRIPGPTLWQLLSDAGRHQVVVNVPITYPPRPINGVMVTGMLTPPSAPVFTYPPDLSEHLHQAGYEIDLSLHEKEFDFDSERLVSRLREVLRKRRDACLQLMSDEPWDFFMVVFTGTDRIQHRFWKYLVPGSDEYSSPEAERLRPLLAQYFRDLDGTIADLVSGAGSGARTMVLSDHGFGPAPDYTVYSISLMQALGLAEAWQKSRIVRLRRFLEGRLGLTPNQIRRWVRTILPQKWAASLDSKFRDAQLEAGAKDVAYSVAMHADVGGIYINRGRFPDEKSLLEFRRRVAADLGGLLDPATNRPFVQAVQLREEIYSGSALDECPDIVFHLVPGYGLSGGVGPKGQLVSPRRQDLLKQGVHRDEGILVLNGPGVEAKDGPRERLLDITATLLYLLDVPIPSAMDSRPILRALDASVADLRPPRYVDATSDEVGRPTEAEEMSREDQEALMDRLRGLGYIE